MTTGVSGGFGPAGEVVSILADRIKAEICIRQNQGFMGKKPLRKHYSTKFVLS